MPNYPDWILERAFGGSMVADTPGHRPDSHHWPQGESAPAAADCCELLVEACNQSNPSNGAVFVFLVGGAGNGKSYLANKVTNEIAGKRLGEASTFASRAYDYLLDSGRFLRVVNDATIPTEDETLEGGYLWNDIKTTLEKSGNLLVCVNRGILVSESKFIPANSSEIASTAPRCLINWLLNGGTQVDTPGFDDNKLLQDVQANKSGYYAFCKLRDGDTEIASVHVAFMDNVSMLEPLPNCEARESLTPMEPLVTGEVSLLPVLDGARNDSKIPILEVLKSFYSEVERTVEISSLPGKELDPFLANLRSLKNEQIISGLCGQLRGMEIITGNHLTYRDAWGIAVMALFGAMPSTDLGEYGEWVSLAVGQANDTRLDSKSRLSALVELALRRTGMAVFSPSGPDCFFGHGIKQPNYPPVQAVEAMASADPLLGLDETSNNIVKDKLSLLDEKKGPGQTLAGEDEGFRATWTALDQKLEDTLLEWLYSDTEVIKFGERNQLLSWYGQYLHRLYALSRGQCSYVDIVNRWQRAWMQCKFPNIPSDLQDGLSKLVFKPFEEPKPITYLPFFSPRVIPISRGDDASRLALKVESHDYRWAMRRSGDSILLKLQNVHLGDNRVAELVLDFSLLREILVQSNGSGFTEAANDIEPRIERLRAEILTMEIESASLNETALSTMFVDGDRLVT